MADFPTLAAVDLGSNSFHLQVARVVGEQIYPLDGLREPVRLGAGLREDKVLDEPSQERAIECLMRFGERLRGLPNEELRGNVQTYMDAHPQVESEITGIRQPLTDLRNRCDAPAPLGR